MKVDVDMLPFVFRSWMPKRRKWCN